MDEDGDQDSNHDADDRIRKELRRGEERGEISAAKNSEGGAQERQRNDKEVQGHENAERLQRCQNDPFENCRLLELHDDVDEAASDDFSTKN